MKFRVGLSITIAIAAGFIMSVGPGAMAHTPDRCFHTHYGGNTKCKRGIVKKSCSDADGNKGRCYQSGSHCYCKLYPKKDRSGERLLDLGIAIGGALLEKEERRKHRRDRQERYEREYED